MPTRVEAISQGSDVVDVADVLLHLRAQGVGDEVYLAGTLIPGVVAKVEERYGAALSERQFRQTQDDVEPGIRVPDHWHPPRLEPTYSGSRIRLLRRPVISVEKVAVLDDEGTETAFTDYYVSGEYVVLRRSLPPRRRVGGIVVEFTAGGQVSDSVRLDLMRLMADVYDQRGLYVSGTIVTGLPDVSGLFTDLREVVL